MKLVFPMIVITAGALVVGCDQQERQGNAGSGSGSEQSFKQEKDTIQESAKSAKEEVERQAKAQKEMLDAQAKSAEAKIDAEKARAKAAGTDAQGKVEQANQQIQEAAGSATTRAQSQTGGQSSTSPAGTTPDSTPTASSTDQNLKQQIESALKSDQANPGAANVQVEVSGDTVTIKGTAKDSEEKSRIEAKVKGVQGVTKVDNQLQVQTQ